MKQTTFEEFVELARRGTFVPVVKEIIADLLTPGLGVSQDCRALRLRVPASRASRAASSVARYSFLGKDPFLVLRSRGRARRRSTGPA